MELQKTFKESYVKTLKDNVKSKSSIELYKADSFEIPLNQVKRLAGIYAPNGLEEKLENLAGNDFEAAKVVYEAYKDISPLLASNEAFWAYITHTSMFHYTQKRWPEVFESDINVQYILDHWFIGGSGIMRNAAASLWWTVHNTIDESREDKYELTAILFKNYTFRTNTFGISTLIRHREAMIGILDFLRKNPEITQNYFEPRGAFISKYFNRLGAVKQLTYLDRDYFYSKCESLKDKILSVTTRGQVVNDYTLYSD